MWCIRQEHIFGIPFAVGGCSVELIKPCLSVPQLIFLCFFLSFLVSFVSNLLEYKHLMADTGMNLLPSQRVHLSKSILHWFTLLNLILIVIVYLYAQWTRCFLSSLKIAHGLRWWLSLMQTHGPKDLCTRRSGVGFNFSYPISFLNIGKLSCSVC